MLVNKICKPSYIDSIDYKFMMQQLYIAQVYESWSVLQKLLVVFPQLNLKDLGITESDEDAHEWGLA